MTRGLVQPDGKLLAFGFDTDQGRFSLPRVWRLQADGSIDDTFQLDASFGNGVSDSVQSAALRADGKIDVFLSGHPTGTVARLTASGSLDAGFGIGGKVLTSGSSSLLIELDDGNWLGLDQTSHSFEIVTPDGTRVATSVPVPAFGAPAVRPTTGGFVVASGPLDAGGASVLLRLRSDLSLDPAFGAGGILQFSDFTLQDMALTSDGKIVIAGNGFVARLDPDGSIDPSFRNGTEADLGDLVGGGQACLRGLIVDAQDRITFAWTNLGHELRLVRFLP